jgi:hypothetical protein
MTDNGTTASTQPESTQPEENPAEPEPPELLEPADDPGYLLTTGEAVGEDGSIVPIIGGLPAVQGSAWDIGAPADERGVIFTDEQETPPEPER